MNRSRRIPRTTGSADETVRLQTAQLGDREVVLPRGRNGETGRAAIVAESLARTAAMEGAGLRCGARGTQSSRSIMLREPREVLRALPPEASRADYSAAIVDENVLGKPTRPRTVIPLGLGMAKWVLEKGSGQQRAGIHDLVLSGMEYLVKDLRYDREDTDTCLLDIPLTRWRSIELTRTLARQEPEMPPVVRQWLATGRDNRLPEVRRVAESRYEESGIVG